MRAAPYLPRGSQAERSWRTHPRTTRRADCYRPIYDDKPRKYHPDRYRPSEDRAILWSRLAAHSDIPCAGESLIVTEKVTGKAIHLHQDRAMLAHVDWNAVYERSGHLRGYGQSSHKRNAVANLPCVFTCIESDGWFGFYSESLGAYLGFDETGTIRAKPDFRHSERFVPIARQSGGFQLLMPTNGPSLAFLMAASGTEELLARLYGETQWEFVKV
jgi:hypothetical protein